MIDSKPNSVASILLNDPIHHCHLFVQAILFTQGFTLLITDLLKCWAGRLRPDFLDRCKPPGWDGIISLANRTVPEPVLICTGNPLAVNEGRLSFPSGHSSTGFAGATLLGLWIFIILLRPKRSLRLLDIFHHASLRFSISFFPVIAAIYVAMSRVEQNIHHPTDVMFGAVLGTVIAIFFFYQTFVRKVEIVQDEYLIVDKTKEGADETLVV